MGDLRHIEPEYKPRPASFAEDALFVLKNMRQQFKRSSSHSDVEMCLDLTIGALVQQMNTSTSGGEKSHG